MSKPEKFDAVWKEYVNEYKKINVKAYEDRINEQLQWRIQNWSSNKREAKIRAESIGEPPRAFRRLAFRAGA